MTLEEWGLRVVALMVAWNLVVAVCAVVGRIVGFRFWPEIMVWVLVGLVLMLRNSFDAPIPSGETVDVIGALRMLGWSALWPMRIFNK